MTKSPFTNNRRRNSLIIIGSILAIATVAAGTALTMKRFVPVKSSSTQQTSTKTPQQKAEELLKNGDYAGAKAQYDIALKEYESSNNVAAAQDVKMQLQVIEMTTTKAEQAPQNTDKSKISVGTSPQ